MLEKGVEFLGGGIAFMTVLVFLTVLAVMESKLALLLLRNIRKRGTSQGGTSKMRSWTRVRRNGAFGARAQGFMYLTIGTRHLIRTKTGLDPSRIRINAHLHCVWKWFQRVAPPRYPPPL